MVSKKREMLFIVPCLLLAAACYEKEELAGTNYWENPLAPEDTENLWVSSSILEASKDGNAGHAMSGIGDVNGDGFDDILIGDPYYGSSETIERKQIECPTGDSTTVNINDERGAAYLIYGKEDGLPAVSSLGNADAIFEGEEGDSKAGYQVSKAGDVNNDGFSDFIVLAGSSGFVCPPANGIPPRIWRRDDLPSKAYLYYGSASRFVGNLGLGSAPTQFVVTEPYRIIQSAHGVGDLNGDGLDDVAVKITFSHNYPEDMESTAASVHIYFGREGGFAETLTPEDADLTIRPDMLDDSNLKISLSLEVAPIGDINGDGLADLTVAQDWFPITTTFTEADRITEVFLLLGKEDMSTGTETLSGVSQVRIAGDGPAVMSTRVAGVGDLNGDGFDDFTILGTLPSNIAPDDTDATGDTDSSQNNDSASEQAEAIGMGNVYVILGNETFNAPSSATEPTFFNIADADTVIQEPILFIGDYLAMGGAGDLNGDSFDELIVGHPYYNDARGAAALFYGSVTFGGDTLTFSQADAVMEGVVVAEASAELDYAIREMVGAIVGSAGDFNGDSRGDILIAAPWSKGASDGELGRIYVIPGGTQN